MRRRKFLNLALLLISAGVLVFHWAHRGVLILHYHAINLPAGRAATISISPADFAWQMDYLHKAGYKVVTLEEAVDYLSRAAKLSAKAVAITFDDGYRDNFELAWPILQEHNFPATIFMVTGEIGGVNRWDIAKGFPRLDLLGWSELEALENTGIRIMPHTVRHLNITKLTPGEARAELEEAKASLEKRLSGERPFFAYPYGSLNQEVVDLVKEAGYRAAFTSSPGTNVYGQTDVYRIRRMPVKEAYQGFWGRLLFLLALKLNSLYPASS